jgi:hypothetical protein
MSRKDCMVQELACELRTFLVQVSHCMGNRWICRPCRRCHAQRRAVYTHISLYNTYMTVALSIQSVPYYSLRNTIKDDTGYEVFLSLTGTVMK